jgi:hypothetical protein
MPYLTNAIATPMRRCVVSLTAIFLIPTTIASARLADLPPQALPVYGGGGGTSFTRNCGTDRVMTGFQFRRGLWIDGIGLLCRPVSASGALGAESAGSMAGGTGGTFGKRSCPTGTVVAGGVVEYGSVIETFRVYCRDWKPATRSFGTNETLISVVGNNPTLPIGRSKCENATQPVITIRGRAGAFVDAVGFTCDEP